ncbi:MAG: 30S ribosomal protein S4 [Owenweeksia sp.]|nr:30S ribosomal protein S4 [Owenweeksia sp.]
MTPSSVPIVLSKRRTTLPDSMAYRAEEVKRSEYAVQLAEKQKAKYTYGILERQFANMFEKASSAKGITGEVLLQMCESRLDNAVFRLGIASTRRAARQFVGHRHITVNGELVNIPSYQLKAGDVVAVREKSEIATGHYRSTG